MASMVHKYKEVYQQDSPEEVNIAIYIQAGKEVVDEG